MRRGIAAKQELQSICENLMDNCLAPSSETGGVGCDNMTVIIVGLLRGKTKDEWYKEIADRVANGDGPCAPPEYGKSLDSICQLRVGSERFASNVHAHTAEFRGPGIHHRYDDSGEDYDMDMDQRTRHIAGMGGGRIILLGDGSEFSNESGDSDMFDQDEEDKDLESQVPKGEAGDADSGYTTERSKREETPGPHSKPDSDLSEKSKVSNEPPPAAHTGAPGAPVTDLSEKTADSNDTPGSLDSGSEVSS